MRRFEERKQDYFNALERLKEATLEEPTELAIDAVLHRFEFTFELSWKTIKDYLELMGISKKMGSPRETLQSAFKQGIIEDGEQWIDMMISRNTLSHIYDENTSRNIYDKIKNIYLELFLKLKEEFENM